MTHEPIDPAILTFMTGYVPDPNILQDPFYGLSTEEQRSLAADLAPYVPPPLTVKSYQDFIR